MHRTLFGLHRHTVPIVAIEYPVLFCENFVQFSSYLSDFKMDIGMHWKCLNMCVR